MDHNTRHGYIDALRGLAIIGVLCIHTGFFAAPASAPLRWLADNGARGVQLFYVISACTLLMSIRKRAEREERPWLAYTIRRLARIMPMFYVAMLAYLLIAGLGPSYWAPRGVTPGAIISTALFANGWHPEWINAIVQGGWSIAIETNFYILLPFLALVITNLERAIIAFLISLPISALLAAQAWRLHPPQMAPYLAGHFTYLWLPAQLPVFLAGMMLYYLLPSMTQWASGPARKSRAVMLLLGSLLAAACLTHDKVRGLPDFVAFALSFILLAGALAAWPTRLLVNPFFRRIGQVSYSIYLLHYLFLQHIPSVAGLLSQYHLRISPDVNYLLTLLMLLALSVGVGSLAYRFIEEPGMELGRRIIRRCCVRREEHAPATEASPAILAETG